MVEEAYHETNRWLIEQRVLPEVDLRPFIRRSRGGGSAGGLTTTGGGAQIAEGQHSGSFPESSVRGGLGQGQAASAKKRA